MPTPTIKTIVPHHRGDPFLLASSGFHLQHQALAPYPWLVHGFSLRHHPASGKELDLGTRTPGSRKAAKALRNAFVTSLTGKEMPLVLLHQTHSDRVHCLDRDPSGERAVAEGDALITRLPQVLLGVQVADCLPVLIADEAEGVVAAVHAGWRGLLGGIVPETIQHMNSRYSSHPRNCLAVMGPSIGPCCYEVGQDVAEPFEMAFGPLDQLFGVRKGSGLVTSAGLKTSNAQTASRRNLNLRAACRYQLEAAGLPGSRIFSHPPCTSCHREAFFSYRAEPGISGRMLAVIGKTGQL